MKHEGMKLLTYRTEEWIEESNEVQIRSMNSSKSKNRAEMSKNRELEMAQAGGEEERKYVRIIYPGTSGPG